MSATDTITIKIACGGETVQELREQGLLFETIAEALDIPREDITEVTNGR